MLHNRKMLRASQSSLDGSGRDQPAILKRKSALATIEDQDEMKSAALSLTPAAAWKSPDAGKTRQKRREGVRDERLIHHMHGYEPEQILEMMKYRDGVLQTMGAGKEFRCP